MIINTKELLRQLESVTPGLSKNDDLEQANCFVFTDGRVQTYNEEVLATQHTDLKITCSVPAKPLLETLRKLTEDEVDIKLDKDQLVISCPGTRRIRLNVHAETVIYGENIPRATEWLDVPPAFSDGLAMVAECASKESEQFSLTCVEISKEGLQSTDSYQAIRFKLELPIEDPFLIRRDSCVAVTGLGVAAIFVSPDWFGMKTYTGLEVYVRKYGDEFPCMDHAFQAECVSSIRFPASLLDATQKAIPFLPETATGKQAVIRLKPKKMMVCATNMHGSYEEIRDVDYEGPAFSFAINPKYIQGLLKHDYPCHLTRDIAKIRGDNFSMVVSLESPVT